MINADIAKNIVEEEEKFLVIRKEFVRHLTKIERNIEKAARRAYRETYYKGWFWDIRDYNKIKALKNALISNLKEKGFHAKESSNCTGLNSSDGWIRISW